MSSDKLTRYNMYIHDKKPVVMEKRAILHESAQYTIITILFDEYIENW